MEWFVNWVASPGLWRGAVYMLMAAGVTLDPNQQNAIIAGGLALSGLIHAFTTAKAAKP